MGHPPSSNSTSLRILAVLIVVGSFTLGGTLAFAVLYARHIVETTALGLARVANVKLAVGEVRWGIGFIQVFDSQFELEKVPGVAGTIRRVDIDFSGLEPQKLLIEGIKIAAKGDPVELYRSTNRELDRLRRVNWNPTQRVFAPKVEYRHLDAKLESTHPLIPNVQLTDLEWSLKGGKAADETAISTASTRLDGKELGALSVVFRQQAQGLDLGWGKTLEDSKWTLSYRDSAAGTTVVLAFNSTKLTELMAKLGQPALPQALAKAQAAGVVTAQIDPTTGRIRGKITLRLTDFVPPHPAELNGYAFKDTTRLDVTFDSDPLALTTDLPVIQLVNGEISLLGNGRVERKDLSAKLRADLSTRLDCVTLAKGFAADSVGGALGNWAQKNAAKAVRGSVGVRVQVDADTEHLENAKVVKRVGIGCGLRPLSLEALLSLGLPPPPEPKTVERMMKQLPKAANLPALPSLFPSLDELIDVNLRSR